MSNFEQTFICVTEAETEHLAAELSKLCRAGDVFALIGTLGMGKSVFARGFIQSLCGKTEVPSPTFTLVQMYDAPNFEVYHYDLYRLKSPEEIFELGMEEAMYEGVCLIEWPNKMGGYLPRSAIKINIEPTENGRKIIFTFASEQAYQRFASLKG